MDNLGEEFRNKYLQAPRRKGTYKPASIWRRAASLVLDILVLNILVFSAFGDLLTEWFSEASLTSMEAAIPTHIYLSITFIAFLSLMYFALLQYYSQQTIGMMITQIYVMPEPSFWKSIARNLYLLPFFPFNLLWVVEPAFLAFKGKRLLESLTNTNTVEAHK